MQQVLRLLRILTLGMVGISLSSEHAHIALLGVNVTPTKVVTLMLLVLVALQWALEPRPSPDRKRVWVFFFGVAIFIGALHSFLNPYVANPNVRTDFITWIALFLTYLILTYTVTKRSELDILLLSFVFGIGLVTVSAFLGFGLAYETKEGMRASGQGGNVNLFAFNLLIAIGAAGGLMLTATTRFRRLVYMGLITLMLLGIMGTLSRAALVSLPVMAAFWSVRFRRADILQYALPGLLVLVIVALLAPEGVIERLGTLSAKGIEEDSSASKRVQDLPLAFMAFFSNPLIGVGLDGYKSYLTQNGYPAPNNPHNAFIQVAAQFGLLGLVPFTALIFLTWTDLSRTARLAHSLRYTHDRELHDFYVRALMLQVGFVGALVDSMFHATMRHKGLWFVFALSTLFLRLTRARARRIQAQQPVPEAAALVEAPAAPLVPQAH